MPGICVAVKTTTSIAGSSRNAVLKLWKSRPAAPMMTMRRRGRSPGLATGLILRSGAELPRSSVSVGDFVPCARNGARDLLQTDAIRVVRYGDLAGDVARDAFLDADE